VKEAGRPFRSLKRKTALDNRDRCPAGRVALWTMSTQARHIRVHEISITETPRDKKNYKGRNYLKTREFQRARKRDKEGWRKRSSQDYLRSRRAIEKTGDSQLKASRDHALMR